MRVLLLPRFGVVGLSASLATALLAQGSTVDDLPAVVQLYCGDCHTGPEPERDLALEPLFASGAAATADPVRGAVLEKVLRRLRARTMPPDDAHAPNDAERAVLVAAFREVLPPDPQAQVVTLRRLSRREYARTIHDLTGVLFAAEEILPEDPRTYGYDNLGDGRGMSPLAFEKYYEAAGVVAAAMVAEPTARVHVFDDERPLASTLAPFLERVFRRPVDRGEVQERLDFFDGVERATGSATQARVALLRSLFVSPEFLFRVEGGQAEAPARLTPHELAVRLAYFLTSSLPDEPLFALARSGALADPAVLVAEVPRLLAASAGRRLAEDFVGQWLRFVDVLSANADFRRYPEIWNGKLRPALYEEAIRFVAALLVEDGSVLSLLDADHTWLNATLAKHYGFGGDEALGNVFVRVAVPDRRRGGVLGMGAMLMVSSHPLRTSPVLRGKWILDLLLDEPPAPPPANAGVLPADDQQPDGLTLRERLQRHRRDPSCAQCHARIDPLGFALENYDVLGRWRTEVHGKPVDASGELPDGTRIDGPIALKDALLARRADFVRALVKQMLVYAVGRPMTVYDEREIERLSAVVAAGEYRFSALLGGIVTSPLFVLRQPGDAK